MHDKCPPEHEPQLSVMFVSPVLWYVLTICLTGGLPLMPVRVNVIISASTVTSCVPEPITVERRSLTGELDSKRSGPVPSHVNLTVCGRLQKAIGVTLSEVMVEGG